MFVASLFQDFVVQPIFNLLVFIYALIPGHDFGLAIIVFTIIVRFLMWPLVKKQLHQATAMRKMQPEIKRIKKAAKGNKQQESLMLMELYKERGISPFGSIGTIAVQFVILIGLYSGLTKLLNDPQAIVDFAYPFIQNLSWMQTLATDITKFNISLLGIIDLNRAAISNLGFYFPAMVLVIGSAVGQYFQSLQLMPKSDDGRTLRAILKEASTGKEADQAEVTAAINRSMRYLIPGMILVFTVSLPAALSLYWMTSSIVAYFQQARILNQDEAELESLADEPDAKNDKKIIEGEVVESTATSAPERTKKSAQARTTKAKKRKRKGKQ